jgi:hypothetical protein
MHGHGRDPSTIAWQYRVKRDLSRGDNAGCSVQGLPNHFIPLDHQLNHPFLDCSNLPLTNSKGIIQPAVIFVIAHMGTGYDDLPASRWIRSAVAPVIEIDHCLFLGFDDSLKVWEVCTVTSAQWVVGASKGPLNSPGAVTVGK